jgi:hypothetical protein
MRNPRSRSVLGMYRRENWELMTRLMDGDESVRERVEALCDAIAKLWVQEEIKQKQANQAVKSKQL